MPETILVVEYEPRYTDRVRQALAGQPFATAFAKDGEEALRAFASSQPTLIVLSSVVPKATTSDLIRAIRSQSALQQTPILLTVSGYVGKTPQADAQRVGASDILPKPYSEGDFLGKVRQMLGVVAGDANIVRPAAAGGQFTSSEIFGDLLSDDKPAAPKKTIKPSDDVEKMLEATLGGMMPRKTTSPGTTPKPVTSPGTAKLPGSAELDKILHDTLSGLEKTQTRPKSTPPAASPVAAPSPAAPPQTARPASGPQPVVTPPPAPVSTPPAAPPRVAPVTPPPQARPVTPPVVEKVPASSPVIAPAPQQVTAAAAEEPEPTDGTRFGQYVLLEKIATGGMAEVWKARMRGVEGFQKIVAIKKILPHLSDNRDFIDMFIDEAKLAAQLTHNNIIHIYDLGKIQSSYYIAMEYVDGWDLKTILKKAQEHDQPLTIELALFIASKIAAALDYAHRRRDFNDQDMGLVHRDVSPQNVLISQEGDIKLCDFGIAKAASKASHTQTGALKGKLQYMSPEQAWGRTIDRRSDIFALATVLFELLTARKLFSGENELSILEQVREARVTAPSLINDEVTPDIDKIVLKALQKEPENRYQTAGEMARDIDQILYSFRPTPTSADLAIYMHRLSNPLPVSAVQPDLDETVVDEGPVLAPVQPTIIPVPRVTPAPATIPTPQPSASVSMPAFEEPEEKKKPVALIAIAAVVVLAALGAGVFFMMRKPAAPVTQAAQPAAAAAATASAAPATATQTAAPVVPMAPAVTVTPTTTSFDQSQVEAEVKKRLEAERQRLEQLARASQQTQTTAPAPRPAAATQAPAPRPVQTAAAAPPPVTETHATVAPPTQTIAPPPVTETHAPAPAPVQTETVARTREGDLVSGGEGLTPARLVRLTTPEYPILAREQRVEGLVLLSVLVSESGQVLQVKLIRGVNKPVGLNEAAEAAVRRSSFAPGVKDGVRVKSWMTVPINFKL